jgi:hypothetical protein
MDSVISSSPQFLEFGVAERQSCLQRSTGNVFMRIDIKLSALKNPIYNVNSCHFFIANV